MTRSAKLLTKTENINKNRSKDIVVKTFPWSFYISGKWFHALSKWKKLDYFIIFPPTEYKRFKTQNQKYYECHQFEMERYSDKWIKDLYHSGQCMVANKEGWLYALEEKQDCPTEAEPWSGWPPLGREWGGRPYAGSLEALTLHCTACMHWSPHTLPCLG